jgi:long-subunit fatty acid transport protein
LLRRYFIALFLLGIGDVRFKGTVENRSMAGIAVEQDSIHINLQNPASFANLKFTTFALGYL